MRPNTADPQDPAPYRYRGWDRSSWRTNGDEKQLENVGR